METVDIKSQFDKWEVHMIRFSEHTARDPEKFKVAGRPHKDSASHYKILTEQFIPITWFYWCLQASLSLLFILGSNANTLCR